MTSTRASSKSPPSYSDAFLRKVLERNRVVAVVGASADWARPSCYCMQYMQSMGYRMIPVNPTLAGTEILGRKVYAHLREIEEPIDLVSIFRKPQAVGQVVDDAIAIGAKTIWMQEGIRNDEAGARAEAAGLDVVMDRCPKKEHFRLFGGSSGAETSV